YAPRAIAERFVLQTQIRDATLYNQWVVTGAQFRQAPLTAGTTYPVFPNNVIPQNMLDPTSVSLLKYLPPAGEYFLDGRERPDYRLPGVLQTPEKRPT